MTFGTIHVGFCGQTIEVNEEVAPMTQTKTSTVQNGHGAEVRGASDVSAPTRQRPRVAWLVAVIVVCLLGLGLLGGGGWGLWKDRIDRHGGYISIGTTELHTETYAIISDLKGDGPGWLYGS